MATGAPTWDFPRNPFGTLVVLEVAEERGIPTATALASTGLQRSDLIDPDFEVAAGQELTVIRNVLRQLGDLPGLGACAGERVTLGMLGVWGVAMLNSETPRDVLNVAVRYGFGWFSFVFGRPWVDEAPSEMHTVLDIGEVPADAREFLIERDLCGIVSVSRKILGTRASMRVETTLAASRAEHLAVALSPHVVEAGCARNAVILPRSLLDAPLPNADKYALARWTRMCDDFVSQHRDGPHRHGVAATVRAMLMREPYEVPSLEDVAASRNVSVRTLRRQLAGEGTSFRALMDDVRKAIAEELLTRDMTITEVAHRLDFADAASFIRAFKRWTGHTPGTGRKSSLAR
jgi:AraC-like DNA-binding protein